MIPEFFQQHWLAVALLVLAVAMLGWGLTFAARRLPWLVGGTALALLGVGGFQLLREAQLPDKVTFDWGLFVLFAAAGTLVFLVLLLFFTRFLFVSFGL